jgi:uncharacterized protein YjiS (DUF1127 family)
MMTMNTAPLHAPSPAAGFAQRIGAAFSNGINRMQIARMASVLSAMSDDQLAAIDLKRRDIPQRAADLVNYSYDGL